MGAQLKYHETPEVKRSAGAEFDAHPKPLLPEDEDELAVTTATGVSVGVAAAAAAGAAVVGSSVCAGDAAATGVLPKSVRFTRSFRAFLRGGTACREDSRPIDVGQVIFHCAPVHTREIIIDS